uniref:Uncharacterized protein n=1 Tax=Salmonella phage PMBT18 TaxID=3229742 RepID=A0AB39BZU1_9CAUD
MGECVGNRTRNRQDNEKLLHFTCISCDFLNFLNPRLL